MPGGAVDFHIDDAHIEGLFPGRGYTRESSPIKCLITFRRGSRKTDIETFRLNQLIHDKSK